MKRIFTILVCLLGSFYVGAQCPAGETEITIEVVTAGFPQEIGWELVDQTTGTVIACQPAGTVAGTVVEGPFCVTDGNTIVFTGYDSFGDDWNGGFVNITITEDGSINGCAAQDGCVVIQNGGEDVDVEPDVSVINSCETSNEEFTLTLTTACDATPISGCTDPTAPNFNTCASIDDGSCTPPPPANDMCADAVAIPVNTDLACGMVTNATIESATDSGTDVPPEDNTVCTGTEDDDIWFSFVATNADHQIDLINITGSTTDLYHSVWEGSCGALTNIICSDPNTSTLTGLTPGTTYYVRVYSWTATAGQDSVFDICVGTACTPPVATATAVCVPGDEANFYVEVDVTDIGVGNTAYTVDVGGPQTNITATGVVMYGPFPSGTPVDVVLTGVDDAACGITVTGLDRTCTCPPDLALSGPVGPYCTDDAAVAITYAPTGPFTSAVTITNTADGGFDGEVGFGFYAGSWDDGTALGLPPAGTGLFGTDSETSLEGAIPNDGAGNPDVTTAGNFGGDPLVPGFTQTVSGLAPGNYTIYLVDDFGDGWNGTQAIVTDECGNTITTEQIIEAISADVQDEVAWVNFTLPLQAPVITVTGNGVVQTADPDGVANSGDETYEFDPSMVAATGCDPVTETLTLTTDICGVICEATIDVQVFPPAQAPTITLDDAVCNYTITAACTGDVLDVTSTTAAPGDDPAPIDVTVTTVGGCTATFPVDPPVCPPPMAVCQGIDLVAGFPVIPTTVCSGATADICLTLIDAAEGLTVTGTVDGAPVTLTGTPGAGANELCVTITAPINETCAPVDVVIQIDAIQCTDGTDFPGVLGAPTLVEDLTTAGLNPLNVPVYPTLTVNTSGDGMCGDLIAELVATDGTVCAAAAGSPFTCTMDGETLDFDFTADVAAFIEVPVDCPLPTLTGTLTCGMCTQPCTATVALSANPTDACSTDGTVDICVDVTAGDAAEVMVDVDGITATGVTGDAQVCVAVALNANQTCDAVSQDYMISATCANGDELLPATAGSISVHPEGYTLVTAGDAMCGTLTAELQSADGSTCGTPLSFTCTADGETLNYDFTADADPMACTLPTLTGTLTCGGCDVTPVFTFSIDDPCNCTDGIDEDMDGINDFALETITFTPGSAPYDVTLTMPGLVDATGTILTDADIEALIVAADPGTGDPFDIIVYLPADGTTTYAIQVTDGNGTTVEFVKPEGCPVCPDVANIPTVGEWGLIILGLLMSITAIVGIRQRREEEVYG